MYILYISLLNIFRVNWREKYLNINVNEIQKITISRSRKQLLFGDIFLHGKHSTEEYTHWVKLLDPPLNALMEWKTKNILYGFSKLRNYWISYKWKCKNFSVHMPTIIRSKRTYIHICMYCIVLHMKISFMLPMHLYISLYNSRPHTS